METILCAVAKRDNDARNPDLHSFDILASGASLPAPIELDLFLDFAKHTFSIQNYSDFADGEASQLHYFQALHIAAAVALEIAHDETGWPDVNEFTLNVEIPS